MKNLPLLLGTLIVTVLLIVGAAVLFSNSAKPEVVDQALLLGTLKNVKGPENAKVTVVEFSDLQCPSCKAVQPLVQEILQKYPNDVRFVYRHYPLTNIHDNAFRASQAVEAAGELGKFWELHDLLFAQQAEWAELNPVELQGKFDEYTSKIQIDKTEFQKRIDAQEIRDLINRDLSDGTKAGVDATPTFYVNGQKTPAQELSATVQSLINSQ